MTDSIYNCLWFDGQAQDAANFYCSVFKDGKSSHPILWSLFLKLTKLDLWDLTEVHHINHQMLSHLSLNVKINKKSITIGIC
ncbi:VOC family protein [Sphingobacterium sp. IITKGP-BTPF85]|uniref:VOC family protein n=1 Tax=Sphingobacterium sp. IITKGP-BTPF85 TaxID=1338009 RepID=UPI0021D07273|nr:VOC family protein [Sphingobacterium sp. IITKGP-BTPF85]